MDDHQIMGKKQTSEAPQGFRQTQRYRAQCRTGIGGGRLAHIPVLSLEEFTKPISSTGLCFNGLSLLAFLTAPGGLWVFDLSSGSRLQHSVENQWTQWTSSFSIETAWNCQILDDILNLFGRTLKNGVDRPPIHHPNHPSKCFWQPQLKKLQSKNQLM